MARSKLTPELQAEICKVLRAGNYIEAACAYVGLSTSAFWNWHKRGEEEKARVESDSRARVRKSEAPYVDFVDAVTRARHAAEVESVARIRKAGADGDVQADQWFLERSFRDRWGKTRVDVQHTGAVEVKYVIEPPRILEDADGQD